MTAWPAAPPPTCTPASSTAPSPKPEWTHEAHVVVCHQALLEHAAAEAIDHLRDRISAYNEATGVANTSTGGYHETITRYYVGAVDHFGPIDPDELLAAPACSRDAPFRHWTRDRLFSVDARLGWVEPDLEPLPWTDASAESALTAD